MCEDNFTATILTWYDEHARRLPWRIGPHERAKGQLPDPYLVWLSEIMLQQTMVVTVRDYFLRFTKIWPDVVSLAAAKDADVMAQWAGLGYYARARNLLKCARTICGQYGGEFPDTHAELLTLPGIGPYTAAAISAIAFDRPETVVDGNVERVMARYFAVNDPIPKAKPHLVSLAGALTPSNRPGDYAQAVMDLGATICTPKSPDCDGCPVARNCKAKDLGNQAELPRKMAKPTKPIRYGIIYVAQRNDGAWLLERRAEKGLLGGMLGWPGSEWCATPGPAPPIAGNWRPVNTEIRHTFTHFHLRLRLQTLIIANSDVPDRGEFMQEQMFNRSALPTVMRKVFDAAAPSFQVECTDILR